MCTLSVNDVNDHKFSHGAASYMLNGKNINIMLQSAIKCVSNDLVITGKNKGFR